MKKEKINEEGVFWNEKKENEIDEQVQNLNKLNEKRNKVKGRLNELEEAIAHEELRQKEKEEEEQRLAEIMRLKAIEN
jgi:hypothetical protein